MNFEPRRGQAVGRVVVRKHNSAIVRPDETKTTKFVLLDAVGPDCEARGLRVGDVVLPIKINTLVLDNGAAFRPMLDEADIALVVRGWSSLDEFVVQTESGTKYVPFADPLAAASLGVAAAPPLQLVQENGVHP